VSFSLVPDQQIDPFSALQGERGKDKLSIACLVKGASKKQSSNILWQG
jgi:hypothetical protein